MSDDCDQLARARQGDRSALDALFRLHVDDLYRFCLRLTRSNEAMAQDLAQETLVQAISAIRSFRGGSSFRTWLLAIAHNNHRSNSRADLTHREKLVLLADCTEVATRGTDQAAVRNEERELVQKVFQELPPGQRHAVYLRDILGCSYRETAEVLGTSVNAVKNRIHEGRKKMVASIGRRQPTPDLRKRGHG